MSDEAGIRAVIDRINRAWLELPADEIEAALDGCFADEVVFRGPGFVELGRGADVAAASYAAFVRSARVLECTLAEPAIDVAGGTAVAACGWTMKYALDDNEYTESGHDLLVLARASDDRWRVVWRTLLPAPEPQPAPQRDLEETR